MGLWNKLFGDPVDWRFVKQFDSPYHIKNTTPLKKHILTYYLYENQYGDRKFDVIDSDAARGDLKIKDLKKTDWVFRTKQYRETLRAWLDGAYDPQIPSYDSIKAKEFLDNLNGEKT